MTEQAVAQINSDSADRQTVWTLASQKEQTEMSLASEEGMLTQQIESNRELKEMDLQMAQLASADSRYDTDAQLLIASEKNATDLKIAAQTDAVMAKASLAKAQGYALKESRKSLESMMDWDSSGGSSQATASYYYGFESDRSSLDGRIQSFFDDAAASYTDLSSSINDASASTEVETA